MTGTQRDRELDVWLAEHLLGLVSCDEWEPGNMGSAGGPVLWKRCDHESGTCYSSRTIGSTQGTIGGAPNLTDSGDGMLLVLEAMRKNGAVELDEMVSAEHGDAPASQWDVTFWRGDELYGARSDSLPMAVALAAQRALLP